MMRLAVGLSSLLSCFSARGDSSALQAKSLHRFIKADGLSAACEDILAFGLKGVGEFQFIKSGLDGASHVERLCATCPVSECC